MRIAIIEDNESIARGIAFRLQDRGHATDILADGLQADAFLQDDGNDVIIMDLTLPGLDGIELLRNLRRRGDARPVIVLTARGETSDLVAGLDAGADDYLTKPFAMDELEARLRALMRRPVTSLQEVLRIGPLHLDLADRTALIDATPLDLPRRELALLEALMRAEGRIVSKEHILESLYGTGTDIEEGAIEAHVSRLRKRLRPHGIEIVVQRGLGYRIARAAG